MLFLFLRDHKKYIVFVYSGSILNEERAIDVYCLSRRAAVESRRLLQDHVGVNKNLVSYSYYNNVYLN